MTITNPMAAAFKLEEIAWLPSCAPTTLDSSSCSFKEREPIRICVASVSGILICLHAGNLCSTAGDGFLYLRIADRLAVIHDRQIIADIVCGGVRKQLCSVVCEL